jgi:hypothetical protein
VPTPPEFIVMYASRLDELLARAEGW